MVERGIIKVYFGNNSFNKGHYGFIRVIGKNNLPTEEEVYFHFKQARRLETVKKPSGRGTTIGFSTVRAGIGYFDGVPRKGDYVVFEAEPGTPKRRVTAWISEDIWDEYVSDLFWKDMDSLDESDFDTLCPGGCGQPATSCTCVELASFRSHDSMTEGYWTP